MHYNDFKNKLTKLTKFRNKNYSVTDEEIEDVIDIVYTELMSDTHITFVAELVYPDCPEEGDNVSCCDSVEYGIEDITNMHYPAEYLTSQKIEVYQITCVDGFIVDRMLDKIHRNRYALNFNALLNTGHCRNDPMDTPLVFHWKCIPDIVTLEDWIYDTIYQPMLEGLNYYIESTIPSQVDNGVANWSYKRWFNAREKLVNQFPQFPEVGRVKWIDAPICGESCNEIGQICLDFVLADKGSFYACDMGPLVVSAMHNSCTDIVRPLPTYGLTCVVDYCPDCVDFKIRDCGEDGLFWNFWTDDPYKFKAASSMCSCGECPELIKCGYFIAKPDEKLIPKGSDGYIVGLHDEGCNMEPIIGPDFGLNCTQDSDCPDCILFKSFVGTDSLGAKIFQQFVAYRSRLLVGYEFNSCDTSAIAPTEPFDLTASNNEEGRVLLTWRRPEYGSPEPVYDVRRDGSIVASDIVDTSYQDVVAMGTYTYRILAKNASGEAWSVDVEGTALDVSITPNSPTNFQASNDREEQILVTFNNSTSGNPVPTYNLYANGIKMVSDITSGYLWTATPGTYDMYVRAINSNGYADSNMDEGKSLTIHEAFYTVNAKLFIVVPGDTLKVEV